MPYQKGHERYSGLALKLLCPAHAPVVKGVLLTHISHCMSSIMFHVDINLGGNWLSRMPTSSLKIRREDRR